MSNELSEITSNECMLSTKDNPYNPFENFDEWYLYDMEKGWNSCGRLARIAKLSDDMSEEEVDIEIENAIDSIIKNDILNVFIKVRPDSVIKPEKIDTEDT
jgi:hypothetical protein